MFTFQQNLSFIPIQNVGDSGTSEEKNNMHDELRGFRDRW